MLQFSKILSESFRLAFNELRDNPLRSFLSLLGISIGIFLIIAIQTASDWLNSSIDDSVNTLGENTVYIQKYPWVFEEEYPWWEYVKRPIIKYENYLHLRDHIQTAEAIGFFNYFPDATAKTHENTVSNFSLYGCTPQSDVAGTIVLKEGRFFNDTESRGSNVAIIGEKLAKELFGDTSRAVGATFRLNGKKFVAIGLVAEDDNLISFLDWDESIIVPYKVATTMYSSNSFIDGAQWMVVKAKENIPFEQLRDDITGAMRASRKIRPIQDNNFAINRVTVFLEQLKVLRNMLNITKWFLAIFALLIGGFGVANIMFVSVRERTKYIGLKKAIGAPKWVILSEFLIEAIILCIVGSLIGLFFLQVVLLIAKTVFKTEFALSPQNVAFGVALAVGIGLISGIIPAITAANMRPVKALRS